ncbi:MAG TPA: hypothetical protein PKE45_24045, partial [Caldilineaceae bacterium]|nr:hypothetical protein [Caldilineaceae bacterium]
VGALLVGRILATVPYPDNFALVFVLAYGMMMVSWVGLVLTREPASTELKPRIPIGRYLGQLPGLLRANANYRRF